MTKSKRKQSRVFAILIAMALLFLLVLASSSFIINKIDWRQTIIRQASAALRRLVSMDAAKIHLGWPISISADNLRIANAPWGTEPDMIRIGHMTAQIDPGPLLHGIIRYRNLQASDFDIFLERDASGHGNWKFAGLKADPSNSKGGLAFVPANRSQFPVILQAHLENGRFRMRTFSGSILNVTGRILDIQAGGDDRPIHLALSGSYDNMPAALQATTASYKILRQPDVPWPVDFILSTGDDRLHFQGTMMKPLDFDGLQGSITFDAPQLSSLLSVAGMNGASGLPLKLAGPFQKQGDHWDLRDIKGHLKDDLFSGRLQLDEGGYGKPDRVTATLSFDTLNLEQVFKNFKDRTQSAKPVSLRPDDKPGTLLRAALKIKATSYSGISLQNVALGLVIDPGIVTIRPADFTVDGGQVSLTATIKPASPNDGQAAVALTIQKVDIIKILSLAGFKTSALKGAVDGWADLTMTGATMAKALGHLTGEVFIVGKDGTIQRKIVEEASTDLRALFHADEGTLAYRCLIVAMEARNGSIDIPEIALSTSRADLYAVGSIGLQQRLLDLTLTSQGGQGHDFALQIPLHIGGSFDDVAIAPGAKDAGQIDEEKTKVIAQDIVARFGISSSVTSCRP